MSKAPAPCDAGERAAGQAIPAEWLELMVDAEKRRAGRPQDGRSSKDEG